jgi:hypothetical protein
MRLFSHSGRDARRTAAETAALLLRSASTTVRALSFPEKKQILPDGSGRRGCKPGPGDRNSARRGGRNRAGRRRRRADRDLYDIVPHRV